MGIRSKGEQAADDLIALKGFLSELLPLIITGHPNRDAIEQHLRELSEAESEHHDPDLEERTQLADYVLGGLERNDHTQSG